MGTATILQLTQAVGLTGSEALEAVQGTKSVRVTAAQLAALLPSVVATGPTQWIQDAPVPGGNNNYSASNQMAPAVGLIDLAPSATCNISGLLAGFDGQVVGLTNLTINVCVLNALNNQSMTANQFRMFGDLTLTQNDTAFFKYFVAIQKWVKL